MKRINFVLLILIFMYSSLGATTYYVSDNLYTFIHSGPGTKYKIIGSVNAGDHIEVLVKSSDFTQIKDPKGRIGWINSKFVSKQLGLKERLPKLETQVANLKEQLSEAKDKIAKDKVKMEENLKSYDSQLKQLEKLQKLNKELNEKLDTQRNEQLMTWFTYGGMVAGGGLLFGLILPLLIPNRRKKTRW